MVIVAKKKQANWLGSEEEVQELQTEGCGRTTEPGLEKETSTMQDSVP
jgi:hypothetical protein